MIRKTSNGAAMAAIGTLMIALEDAVVMAERASGVPIDRKNLIKQSIEQFDAMDSEKVNELLRRYGL